jgi:hypothetical protein
MSSSEDIQALIEETEALGWNSPIQLEKHEDNPFKRGLCFYW